jgi:hypothetical protein
MAAAGDNQPMAHRPELVVDIEQGWARPAVVLPTFGVIALLGGALPSFSLSANLLVLCVGGLLFWLGMSAILPRVPGPARMSRPAAWWLVPLLFFGVVESATYVIGTHEYPTLSRLSDPVLEGYLARSVAYFGWLAGFWALVRRSPAERGSAGGERR